MTLSWRLLTPASRPGALAALSVEATCGAELDAWLGRLGMTGAPGEAPLRSLLGVDDGLALRVSAREVILTPHGGVEIVRQLARRLEEEGAQRAGADDAPWPEARDDVEAALLQALRRAASPLAIRTLLDHAGRWRTEVPEVSAAVAARLERLLVPPTVAIVGPANVGKSALLNRLARRAVSVVADEPGTTRDHVGVQIDCAGLVVRMLDSPGLRPGAGAVEAEAQELAREQIAGADLLLVCFDAATGPQPLELPGARPDRQRLRVATRADLARPAWAADAVTSAQTGEGIDALAGAVRDALVPPADLAHRGRWRFWEAPSSADHPRPVPTR